MYSITLIQSRLVHVQIRYTVLYLCVCVCVLLHLAVCLLQCRHIVQIYVFWHLLFRFFQADFIYHQK